jgi:hypothetical protein
MESQQFCSEDGCDRDVFTLKSGLCQRHYDRARTARKAAERGDAPLVRDTPCSECGAQGYRRHSDGVLCQRHWDMLRRRGTTEAARAVPTPSAEKAACSEPECANPEHARGLCQTHYRRLRKYGDASAFAPPRARTGSTDHRALSAREKAERLSDRRAARTHCINGHALSGGNALVGREGAVTCRTCRDEQQARYQRRTIDARTHCRAGHLLTENNTYVRKNGVRQCNACVRSHHLRHLYGMSVESFDGMLERQDGKCAVCRVSLMVEDREDRAAHVDHDHSCCPGPQSCGDCVRGILCRGCNLMLGNAHDDPSRLRAAADYLDRVRTAR